MSSITACISVTIRPVLEVGDNAQPARGTLVPGTMRLVAFSCSIALAALPGACSGSVTHGRGGAGAGGAAGFTGADGSAGAAGASISCGTAICDEGPNPSCSGDVCNYTLFSGKMVPAGIATDGTYVFWTDSGLGHVFRIARDGTGFTIIASGQGEPAGIAVDADHVYWANFSDRTIQRALKDGSNIAVISAAQSGPGSVAVDDAFAYWIESDGGNVMKTLKDGSGPASILATGQKNPGGVVIDSANVYWLDIDQSSESKIMRVGKLGTGLEALASTMRYVSLAEAGSYLFWTAGLDNTVGRIAKDGSGPMTLAPLEKAPQGIAADALSVYWTALYDGTVVETAHDGSQRKVLATGQDGPSSITTDGTFAYWMNLGGNFAKPAVMFAHR